MAAHRCRLCGGELRQRFTREVLGRLTVGYHECTSCQSLQTDPPTWLDESYGNAKLDMNGFGAPARCRFMQSRMLVLSKLFGLPKQARVLDYGGGTGLLCRMLCDVGFDAYSFDVHAENVFARHRDAVPGPGFDIVSAIEVWEHFANPAVDVLRCFEGNPRLVVACTGIYSGQDASWPYLFSATGQHVFFYSRQGMEWLAQRQGYEVWVGQQMAIFSRAPITAETRAMLRAELYLTKATECVVPLFSTRINRRSEQQLAQELARVEAELVRRQPPPTP